MKPATAPGAAFRWLPYLVFITAFLILWARRPDILINAQFWAEDGGMWYAEAWNEGAVTALLHPHTGYFQTFSRLTLGAATLMPMEWAPTFSNLVALMFRSAVVGFLASSRMNWAPLPARLFVGLYIVLMPMKEIHANITNTHWYLGMYLVMIFIANHPRSTGWRVHDVAAVTLIGLSGPFAILAAPIVGIRAWVDRSNLRSNWPLYAAWAITVSIQVTAIILFGQQDRVASKTGLGATVPMFFQIVGSHLVAGSLVRSNLIPELATHQVWMTVLTVAAVVIIVYSWVKSGWQLRSLILFGIAVLLAGLISPVQTANGTQWPVFLAGAGERYFIVPRIVLITVFGFALAHITPRSVRTGTLLVAAVFGVAILTYSFVIEPLPDLKWARSVEAYRKAEPGSVVSMPVTPGNGWAANLTSK